ncbi:AAA family ATPase [Chitinibacter sp. SCUT-21]|uniref:AAA family ATPase n=1 Tax=Chitinibacter sp. SCUT-21 TaxID=2970891 RepID=UPI0035A60B38
MQPLLDRRAVGNELRFALAETAAGGCKLTVLLGEAGSGKTQLAQDLLPLVRQRGGMLIESRVESLNWSQPLDSLLLGLSQLSLPLSKQVGNPSLTGQECFLDLARRLGLMEQGPQEMDLSQALKLHLLVGELLAYASEQFRPLVWIVDDLDLLDQDALAVLDYVIEHRLSPYLMLLLCVRDEHHPSLQRWQQLSLCQTLRLSPFSVRDTVAWLIEEQNLNPRLAAEIAPFLQQTCQGNLQLCRFLLDSLAAHDLLGVVPESQWNQRVQQIALQLRTPEAESFFRDKLLALTETGLEILQSASLIGLEFDARLLHDYLPLPAVQEHLELARQYNLIEMITAELWRFVHPNLLRLAAQTLDAHSEAELNARLAKRMMQWPNFALAALRHAQRAGDIFTLPERVQFADQSLLIAEQMSQQGSPLLAGQILDQLLAVIGDALWSEYPELSERIIEAWCATLQEAEQLAELQALQRCVPEHASPRVMYLLAATHMRLALLGHDYQRAFLAAEVALNILHVPMTMAGDRWQIATLFLEWQGVRLFKKAPVHDCQLEHINAAQEVLSNLFGPCFFSRPQMLVAITLKQLALGHRHGLSPSAACTFICAALIYSSLGMKTRAWKYAARSQYISLQQKNDKQRHRAPILDFGFVQPWYSNLQQLLPDIWRWQQNAYAQGDFEYAGYAGMFYLGHSVLNGSPLTHLDKEAAKIEEDLRHTHQQHLLPLSGTFRQFLHQATNSSADQLPWQGTGQYFSEDTLADLVERSDAFSLFNHALCQAYSATMCYAPDVAIDFISQAQEHASAVKGSVIAALFEFLSALNHCVLPQKRHWWGRRKIRQTIERYSVWAADNPSLFGCKCALLQAEAANAEQQFEVAQHYYLQAIEMARHQQHHHEYGMAALYYARFLLRASQFHHARQMLRLAIEQYEAWGALGYVAYLRREYGEFLNKVKG